MDKKTELAYLIDLVMEASSWHLDESDMDLDPIRVEVRHRISVLTGNADGAAQDGIIHNKVPPKPRPEHGHPGQVRVYDHGKSKWYKRELCEQVPCKNSKTKLKWVLKEVKNDA